MRPNGFVVMAALLGAALGVAPRVAEAQGRVRPAPDASTAEVTAVAGPRYEAGRLHRLLLGSGWRDLWVARLDVPVLNVDTFAGGLTPMREGGNAQSITLHFVDDRGRRWIFRSVDKYPGERLAEGLDGTLAGSIVQDQISSHHPAGARVIPPLLDALGVLHVHPRPFVMPDDPRLGEFRERFAGMIGMLEEKPDDVPEGVRGFAGSVKILDTEDLLDRLEDGPLERVAQGELLRARLVDFVIGDTDRTEDNFDWAGFPDPDDDGRLIWRPIPRDRDWAFIRANGLLARLVSRTTMSKLTTFDREHSSLAAHTASGYRIDRRFLTGLDRAAFGREVATVRASLSDSLIDAAVRGLSGSYPEAHTQWLAEAMKARRDALPAIAEAFYAWLASDVDVHTSDEVEHVEILRAGDGTTEVIVIPGSRALAAATDAAQDGGASSDGAFYRRVFRPDETNEIRIFLHGGDDVAIVRGTGRGITIRVAGGGGDDVLVDSSSAPGVFLYGGRGDDRIVRGRHTRTEMGERRAPATAGGGTGDAWGRDWGDERGIGFRLDHRETVGFVLGAGPTLTEYGFRRVPYRWRATLLVLADTRLAPGAQVLADYRFEGSPSSVELDARWSSFDAFRWFGSGNRTERIPDDASLVNLDRVSAGSSFIWRFGAWHREADRPKSVLESEPVDVPLNGFFAIGPVVRRTTAEAPAGSPFAADSRSGSGATWQAGAGMRAELRRTDRHPVPRRGFGMRASAEAFSGFQSERGAAGSAAAELRGYVPLIGDGPHLAMRAGGIRALGDYAPFDAAAVGGRGSLRGFASGRFAGDAAAFGGAELRVPAADLPWIAPGEIGVFGLFDAGRVWAGGDSPGGWHTGRGVGLWVTAFRQAASIAWVSGEQSSLYVWLGLPY